MPDDYRGGVDPAVLESIEALDRRLKVIEDYRRSAPPELYASAQSALRRELELIRAAVGVMAGNSPADGSVEQGAVHVRDYRDSPAVSWDRVGYTPPELGRRPSGEKSVPSGYRAVRTKPPKQAVRENTKISENGLGKYLLGVLASILILLAAGVLATAVWPLIPDVLKFLVLVVAGAGLQALGVRFVLKPDGRANGFWLSVAGLGTAVSLLGIACGCFVWGIYPPVAAGLLASVWFGCNLFVAGGLDSVVFYVIAYAGGILSAVLSIETGPWGSYGAITYYDQISMVMMPVLVLALGAYAAWRGRGRCLTVLNWLTAVFFLCFMSSYAWELTWRSDYDPTYLYGYGLAAEDSDPGIIFGICGLLFFAYLAYLTIDMLRLFESDSFLRNLIGSVVTGISALIGAVVLAQYIRCMGGSDGWSSVSVIFEGCFVSMLFSLFGYLRRPPPGMYVMAWTVPVLALSCAVSDTIFGNQILLSSVFCLVLVGLAWNARASGQFRYISLSAWAALIIEVFVSTEQRSWQHSSYAHGIEPYHSGMIGYVASLLIGCTVLAVSAWFLSRIYLDSDRKPSQAAFPALGGAVLLGYFALRGFYFVLDGFFPELDSEILPLVVFCATLLAHRWWVQYPVRHVRDGRVVGARVACSLIGGVAIASLQFMISFSYHDADLLIRGFGVMYVVASAGSSVAWAVMSGVRLYGVVSVLFANEAVFFASSECGLYGLAMSVIGICLCAGFVWLGFVRQLRGMRLMGLAGIILYTGKIVFGDLSVSGSPAMTAIGLLLAGLVCFGVSFAYNRLDRMYNPKDHGAED